MHITLFVRILFSPDPNPYPGLGHPSPQGHDELSSQCAFCAFDKPPVFVNCTEEPGDIEASGEIEQSGPPRHEYETPVPDRLELGLGHQCRPRRRWRLHEHLVL